MSNHISNSNFYLYTGFDATAADGVKALEYLNDSGITYIHMHYWSGMDEVLNWATQNFANTEYAIEDPQFPFVVYEKVLDEGYPQQVLVHGIENILSTSWADIAAFEG
jgi:uncharacterized protein YjlB